MIKQAPQTKPEILRLRLLEVSGFDVPFFARGQVDQRQEDQHRALGIPIAVVLCPPGLDDNNGEEERLNVIYWKRGEVALLSPEGSHKRSASVYKAGSVLGGARKH